MFSLLSVVLARETLQIAFRALHSKDRLLRGLGPAEANEQIFNIVIWSQTFHKVPIFQQVKHIGRRHKVRFLFGLVGKSEQFGDDFRGRSRVLQIIRVGGDIDRFRRLQREQFLD